MSCGLVEIGRNRPIESPCGRLSDWIDLLSSEDEDVIGDAKEGRGVRFIQSQWVRIPSGVLSDEQHPQICGTVGLGR